MFKRIQSAIRVQKNIRVIRVIRVQKNIECDPCAKNIFVLSELFVFKGAISAERCVVIECRYINI